MSSVARIAEPWVTSCCERVPQPVARAKYVCPLCGQIWWDSAQQIRDVFGPGVERVRAQPTRIANFDYDGWIERMVDR